MALPFEPQDLALFTDLGQLNATGTHDTAACVLRTVDLASDGYVSSIWTFSLDGSRTRKFTLGTSGDNLPKWSPDGSVLAFVSPRDGLPQVHLVPSDGGEARQLSHFKEGAGSIEWCPDGKRLLVSCALSIDPESREARREADAPLAPDAPEFAWRLPYKSDGVGFLLRRTFQLFTIDAQTGEAARVTQGGFDVLSASWSPDGRQIAYVRTREGGTAHRTDLWIADADGGNARQMSRDIASVMSPRWSPDGRWIAFAGGREEGGAQTRLFLLKVASGRLAQLGDDDMEVGPPECLHWTEDSAAVLLIAAHRACQHIVSVAIADGKATTLVAGERHISEFAITPDRLVYFSETPASPRELFTAYRDGTNETQVSFVNRWWWERTPLVAEIRKFQVPDGDGGEETIEGWLVRAKDATGPQPLMVEAHGGPNSFALLGFPWNTYWNVLCSQGWTVLVPHAVGSTSFGRAFAERLNGRWGELDFPQYMATVDAVQRDGIADERVVIAGKSYGGYMAAWAIGHTDRFKAAIVAAPVANLESHYGTSDGGYYSQPYTLGGERHVDPARYRALSPVTYIHNCVTPTLILQGKEDERCPRGQAEELFVSLRACGKAPAEMVMYPGGGHHFFETGKPSHRLDVVQRMIAWARKWT
jgi:dipeptidyl aminopeptidase/acylaminoacyl peptidase